MWEIATVGKYHRCCDLVEMHARNSGKVATVGKYHKCCDLVGMHACNSGKICTSEVNELFRKL